MAVRYDPILNSEITKYVKTTGDRMTGKLSINTNSTTALLIERDGVKDNVLVVDTANGIIGINRIPTAGEAPLQIVGTNGEIRAQSNLTDATNKNGRFTVGHYTNAEEPLLLVVASSTNTDGVLSWGGGSGVANSATIQRFYTASNFSTLTGTIALNINSGQLVTVGVTAGTGRFNVIGSSDIVQAIVKAHSTQTTNLQEWQNSSSIVVASMSGAGLLSLGVAADGTSRLDIRGGASGADMMQFIRTTGVTKTYGIGLSGGGIAFHDVTASTYPMTLLGAVGLNTIVVGQNGRTSSPVTAGLLQAEYCSSAAGTDVAAATFTIQGSGGTGAGTTGGINFQTGNTGSTGTVAHTYSNRMTIAGNGGVTVFGGSDKIQFTVKGHSTQTTNLQEWQNSSGTVLGSISGLGLFSVLPTAGTPIAQQITQTVTDGTVSNYAINAAMTLTTSAQMTTQSRLLNFVGTIQGTGGSASSVGLEGIVADISTNHTADTLTSHIGIRSIMRTKNAGNVTTLTGIRSELNITGAGNITTFRDIIAAGIPTHSGAGVVTTSQGVVIGNHGDAKVTNAYGLYIFDQSGATTLNYAIYTNAGAVRLGDTTTTNGRRQKVTTTAISYTALTTDEIIVCTATCTITLPSCSTTGQTYRIICRTGTTTIDPTGTDTVKGELTQTLSPGEDLILTDTGVWE